MRRFAFEASGRGHDVQVFTVQDRESRYSNASRLNPNTDLNPTVHSVPFSEARRSIIARAIEQIAIATFTTSQAVIEGIERKKPDAVVVTVPALPTAISGWVVSRLFRVPLVVDLRDAWPDLISEIGDWEHQSAGSGFLLVVKEKVLQVAGIFGAKALNLSFRSASCITTTSEWLSASMQESATCHIETVRNSPVRAPEGQDSSILKRDKEPSRLRILYAGTVGRAQGLSNLIEATTLANGSGASIDLQIVGSGAEETLVRSQIASWESNIRFDDPVDSSEIDGYYNWCQVAVVHLRPWEPLRRTIPSKLIEIIDRKIPVLLVGSGESAEIVEQLECGFVSAPGDAKQLSTVLQSIDTRALETIDFSRATEWIDQYCDPRRNAQRFVEIVESVVKSEEREK